MHLFRAALLAAVISLSAAAEPDTVRPPRVGGPCAYETSEITAKVLEIADGYVRFEESDGRTFGQELSRFKTALQPGGYYMFSKRSITTGSCVPVMYTPVDPVTDEVAD